MRVFMILYFMKRISGKQIYDWGTAVLWIVVLVGLPFTSLPILGRITGAMVAPLSAIPLALLILVWFIPYLLRGGSLPGESKPLILFLLAAAAISAASFFLDVTYIKDKTLLSQALRVYVTVAIGMAFYFAFATWPKGERELQKMLQAVHIGGALCVSFALLQAVFVLYHNSQFPPIIVKIRDALVMQQWAVTSGFRITGFAYEPSWFAHQLNILYFPLWLAASYQRSSVYKWRILRLSFENILLLLGLTAFFISSPRVGTIALLVMLAFLLVKTILLVYREIVKFIAGRWVRNKHHIRWVRLLTSIGMLIIFLAFCFTFIYVFLQLGSQRDWRLSLITQNPLNTTEIKTLTDLSEDDILFLGMRFAFVERLTYWFGGWHIFNDYPITGVGLGNAGFFFFPRMPAVGWGTYELREVIYRASALPNIKSLWVRLLAETGIVGFGIFLSWYFVLWRSTRASQFSPQRVVRLIALAGQLALAAFLVEGFSIDSFAMPYLWVSAGLISAAGAVYRRDHRLIEEHSQLPNMVIRE
jgi:hypothetical protein